MSLVAACPECAALHRDLRAIAAALPELPVAVRRRDFRLTEDQAAALRPAGWRRFVAVLAGPRFSFAAPLGTGLATIGIAVLVVSGSLGLPFAAGGAATAERAVSGQRFSAQSPLPSAAAAALDGPGAAASQPAPQSAPTSAPAAATAAPEAPTTNAGTDTAAGDGTDTSNARAATARLRARQPPAASHRARATSAHSPASTAATCRSPWASPRSCSGSRSSCSACCSAARPELPRCRPADVPANGRACQRACRPAGSPTRTPAAAAP